MVRGHYPRSGYPIAPKLLADVLRIPVQPRRGPGRGRLLLCQLDETAWDRFPEAVCRDLGRQVILAVGRAARTPSALANRANSPNSAWADPLGPRIGDPHAEIPGGRRV